MPISELPSNFETLSLVRFFDSDYVEICYRSEWSSAKGTDGGCSNHETTENNP